MRSVLSLKSKILRQLWRLTFVQPGLKRGGPPATPTGQPVLENRGYCPICDSQTTFIARHEWLRDHYRCANCGSLPRERALMEVIERFYPNWPELAIHESSPGNRGASLRLATLGRHYLASHYFPDTPGGNQAGGIRCENLEALTFGDASLDLHITQDVMEHVFHPARVWREIARTLKPGGAHIFTVPLVNKSQPSRVRAEVDDTGRVSHRLPPLYHFNPISKQGSLVTLDWGFDICGHIFETAGLFTQIIYIDDISKGIRAEYIEVLVSQKLANPVLRDDRGSDQSQT